MSLFVNPISFSPLYVSALPTELTRKASGQLSENNFRWTAGKQNSFFCRFSFWNRTVITCGGANGKIFTMLRMPHGVLCDRLTVVDVCFGFQNKSVGKFSLKMPKLLNIFTYSLAFTHHFYFCLSKPNITQTGKHIQPYYTLKCPVRFPTFVFVMQWLLLARSYSL